jgi:hypothetical protein
MYLWEAIGYSLLNQVEITAITSTRIYHGLRPAGSAPCINYFEVSYLPLANGELEMPLYQISCRASNPGAAQDLATFVCTYFHNMKETMNGFDVRMASIQNKMLLPEPETGLYHVPVEIRFSHLNDTVS